MLASLIYIDYQINPMIKGIIFDFNWTLYDPKAKAPTTGAIDLLKTLQDYRLCLVSCCISGISVEKRKEQIATLGLLEYFDNIVVVEHEKTEKDFRHCAEEMKLPPEQILVIGDRITSEIQFGNRLGMTTVRLRHGEHSKAEPENKDQQPDHEITSLAELSCVLNSQQDN
ncbi:MAG: HAD family hydrolase [archaeon]